MLLIHLLLKLSGDPLISILTPSKHRILAWSAARFLSIIESCRIMFCGNLDVMIWFVILIYKHVCWCTIRSILHPFSQCHTSLTGITELRSVNLHQTEEAAQLWPVSYHWYHWPSAQMDYWNLCLRQILCKVKVLMHLRCMHSTIECRSDAYYGNFHNSTNTSLHWQAGLQSLIFYCLWKNSPDR